MKKAANCMSLAASVMRYGGLGSIERWLAALVKYRFVASNTQFCSPVCSPVLTLMPPCSNHHRTIYDQKPRANPSNFPLFARLRCTCHGPNQSGHTNESSAPKQPKPTLRHIRSSRVQLCNCKYVLLPLPLPLGGGTTGFRPRPHPSRVAHRARAFLTGCVCVCQ